MSPSFLNGITILLLYQLVGEVLSRLLQGFVPGPVLGMILLFLTLMVYGRLEHTLEQATSALLSHLSLLFVPAGVGVMAHFGLLSQAWLPISVALVVGTLLTLASTAWIMLGLKAWLNRGAQRDPD